MIDIEKSKIAFKNFLDKYMVEKILLEHLE